MKRWPLPEARGYVNLNTATFDKRGRIWFTGQNGVYGRLDPTSGAMQVWDAPRGRGPYGIATTPDGDVYYASLAGSHIARVDLETGAATVIEPPTKDQGARRVWSDSKGAIWVSEWNAGQVSRYDPKTNAWQRLATAWREAPRLLGLRRPRRQGVAHRLPANAVVRFDRGREKFESFPSDRPNANVRQMLGRPGEVWAPESGASRLVVYRTK